jgi:hypothetical protein
MRCYQKPEMEIIVLQTASMLAASVTGIEIIDESVPFDGGTMEILSRESDFSFELDSDSSSDFDDE